MKKALLIVLLITGFESHLFAADSLDEMLDERIKLNEQYRDEFTKDAEETSVAEQLAPLEKTNGQEWVDYLKYVRESSDIKLKKYVLSLEIRGELINSYYDMEYAEGFLEKTTAQANITKWKRKMDELEKVISGNAEKSAAEKDAE